MPTGSLAFNTGEDVSMFTLGRSDHTFSRLRPEKLSTLRVRAKLRKADDHPRLTRSSAGAPKLCGGEGGGTDSLKQVIFIIETYLG